MMQGKKMWLRACAAFGLFLASGCAQDVGDINRVQPNYVEKAIFDSKNPWYFQETVLDTDVASSGWIFEGYEGLFDKVRFQIEEKYLLAYRVYENVENAGDKKPGADFFGSPVAAYAITGHFDIQRSYNTATGEQSNVIVENTTDRPWYERKYMRVDWSKNLAPNPFVGLVGLQSISALAYYDQEQERTSPDRIRISDNYIDVVGKYALDPSFDYYLTYGDRDDSADVPTSVVKIRHSFRKAQDDDNYEPVDFPDAVPLKDNAGKTLYRYYNPDKADWDLCDETIMKSPMGSRCEEIRQNVFAKFGYFRTERVVKDPRLGTLESGRKQYANRWNLWKYSYEYEADEDGNPIRDESGRIQWKKDEQGNRIPIPMADREPKPITYHLSVNFPEYQKPVAQRMAAEWNRAFKRAVAFAQGKSTDDVPEMFVAVENSCNKENVAEYLDKYEEKLAPVANEVLQGEEIQPGNLEALCNALEFATQTWKPAQRFEYQRLGDLRYSLLNWVSNDQVQGPLGYGPSSADPETGRIIHANANVYGASLETYAYFAQEIIEYLNGTRDSNQIASGLSIKEHLNRTQAESAERSEKTLSPELKQKIRDRFQKTAKYPRDFGKSGLSRSEAESRLAVIQENPRFRKLMVDENMKILFGGQRYLRNRDQMSADELQKLDELATGLNWTKPIDQHKAWIKKQLAHNITPAEMVGDTIIGRAMKHQKDDPETVYNALATEIFFGVLTHEVGHTVGLRHNFEASADALNYFDEYWDTLKKVPAKDFDKVEPTLAEKAYSSIMDYHADFNSDFAGIGKYDEAAIAFGYAGALEVFDIQASDVLTVPDPFNPKTKANVLKDFDTLLFWNSYKKIPTYFKGGADGIKQRKLVKFDDYLKNMSVAWQNQGASKVSLPADVPEILPYSEVPFKFNSDEFEGSFFNNVFDYGASFTKIVNHKIDQYKLYYPFQAFKRDRFGWNPGGYLSRVRDRYFGPMTAPFKYLAYFQYMYGDVMAETDLWDDMTQASVLALNTLGEVLQTPEPGVFDIDLARGGVVLPQSSCQQPAGKTIDIPLGEGKPTNLDFSNDYYYKVVSLGSLYDKQLAIMAMADTGGELLRFNADGAYWLFENINFWRLFKEDMVDFLNGLVTLDYSKMSAGLSVDKDGQGSLVWRPIVADPASKGPDFVNQLYPKTEELYPVYPYIGKAHQFYTLLFGMAFMTSMYDQEMDFAKYAKVMQKGSHDDVTFDEADPKKVAEFTDPNSKMVYRAVQTEDGKSIAFSLVKRSTRAANTLKIANRAVATDAAGKLTQDGEYAFHLLINHGTDEEGNAPKDALGRDLLQKLLVKKTDRKNDKGQPLYVVSDAADTTATQMWVIAAVDTENRPVDIEGKPIIEGNTNPPAFTALKIQYKYTEGTRQAVKQQILPELSRDFYEQVGTLDLMRNFNNLFEFGAVR